MGDLQSKDFWSVSCLDAVALALSRITGDDGEVVTGYREDGPAVFCIRVESSRLGHDRAV